VWGGVGGGGEGGGGRGCACSLCGSGQLPTSCPDWRQSAGVPRGIGLQPPTGRGYVRRSGPPADCGRPRRVAHHTHVRMSPPPPTHPVPQYPVPPRQPPAARLRHDPALPPARQPPLGLGGGGGGGGPLKWRQNAYRRLAGRATPMGAAARIHARRGSAPSVLAASTPTPSSTRATVRDVATPAVIGRGGSGSGTPAAAPRLVSPRPR
jgi:hypothetical protein